MPKSTLFIPELDYALRYWEERNQIAENFFQLTLRGKKIDESIYQKPFIGSEVDDKRNLRRSIENFRNLRTCVERNLEFNSMQFLPRVPKKERDVYTSLNFTRGDILRNISFFPYLLGEWLKFKKAYILQGSGVILYWTHFFTHESC